MTFPLFTTGPQQIVQPGPPQVVTVVPNASFVTRIDARESFGIARADDIVSSPPTERQVMTAAAGDPIARLYGRDRIGPAVVRAVPYLGGIVWLYVWGYGPYDGYEKLWLNDIDVTAALPAGVTFQHFNGTQVAASSLLVSAYAANGKTWTAIMPNVVYSVAHFAANAEIGGAPVVNMLWRGCKPYDPRTGLSVFSDNPALALRDILTASRVNSFGFGLTVDDADIIALANEHDAMIGSPAEKRRTINYNFAERMPAQQMLETLRTAASCFVVLDTFPVRVIADKDAAAVRGFNRSQFRRLRVSRKSRYNRATVVQISYTRIVGDTYERHVAEYARPGVSTGVLPRIVNAVDMYWINRYSQAYREAIERANKLWNDVSVDADAFDEALEVTHGDIVELTDADNGFAAKKFRVIAVSNSSPSSFALALQEHDAGNYSGVVQTAPGSDNTTLPDPRAVPTITGLTLVEKPVANAPGALPLARIEATAAVVTWPFLSGYRFVIRNTLGELVSDATIPTNVYTSPAIPAFDTYTVEAYAVSSVAQGTTPITESITLTASNENSMIEFIGEDISRLQSGLSEWLCNGSGSASLFKIWSGDTTVRARSGARVENDVYTGANQLTPGLATQMLDAARTANVTTSGPPPDLNLTTGETIPVVTGGFIDLGKQRDIVIGVTNISRWLTLYGDRFIIRWKFGNTPSFGNPPGYGAPPYYQVAYGPNARINGRYVQMEILQRWINQGSDGFGGTLWAAQTWQIEFERARISTFLESFVDTINATTLTTGALRVQLNRTYSVVKGVQITALSSVAATTSYGPVFADEINVDGNYVDINAFDSSGARVAVPVSIQITGALAL